MVLTEYLYDSYNIILFVRDVEQAFNYKYLQKSQKKVKSLMMGYSLIKEAIRYM